MNNFEILKKEIKESFTKEEPLVKYNISFPEIELTNSIKKGNEFIKRFNGFYSMLQRRFEEFAKTKLYKEAKRRKCITNEKENFEPFGAVLKFICPYNDGKIISIIMDALVFCGEKQETKRTSQNWETENGRMLIFEDFFSDSDKNKILYGIKDEARLRRDTENANFKPDFEKRINKGFSKNNFYLTPKGYGFYYPAEFLSEKNIPEMFVLMGFKGNGEYNVY